MLTDALISSRLPDLCLLPWVRLSQRLSRAAVEHRHALSHIASSRSFRAVAATGKAHQTQSAEEEKQIKLVDDLHPLPA